MRLRSTLAALTAAASLLVTAVPAQAASRGYALTYVNPGHVVVRWNPCQVIHYKVNLKYAPKGAFTDVKKAVAELRAATGMTISYAGTTTTIPQANWGAGSKPGHFPDLVIAWAAPGKGKGRSNALIKQDAGVGGIYYAEWFDSAGRLHPPQVVTGMVVMNVQYNAVYKAGFGRGYSRGEVLLHELGHAVGLQHVSDPKQMMYPAAIARAKAAYGKGDLAGLRKVGRKAGCITTKG